MYILALIVAAGAVARFWNLDWDQGAYTFHPDEWAINQVVRRLGPDLNPHFFFYGSLPIYLYRATADLLTFITGTDWLDPTRLPLVGRLYSALVETALIPLVFVVGRRAFRSAGAGLLASALTAGAALLIQAAHFGTVDSLLTLFGVALLWISMRISRSPDVRWYVLAGVVLGMALATKLTSATYIVMPLLAHLLRKRERGEKGLVEWLRPLLALGASAGVACLLFAPYYVFDAPAFWADIVVQSNELNGVPPTYVLQFAGTTPYLFELRNLLLWALGVPLGVMALAGWVWLAVRCVRPASREERVNALLLAVWPTIYFVLIGTWQARFVRHTLPLVPFLCLFTAGLLYTLWRWAGNKRASRWLAGTLAGAVVLGTVLWGAAVTAIYTAPEPRLAATGWIHANVPPGSRIVVEDKNDLVPVPRPGLPTGTYSFSALPVTEEDTPGKAADFARTLARGDLIVVPNRRWSDVLPAFPRFGVSGRYYRLLFSGDLGYTPAASFSNPPHLGPLAWPDDSAEETFQVFDHPTVRLFRNTGRKSEAELLALLEAK